MGWGQSPWASGPWATEGATDLTIANATHAHTASNVSLSPIVDLVIQDTSHGHSASEVVITLAALTIQGATHGHTAGNVVLVVPQSAGPFRVVDLETRTGSPVASALPLAAYRVVWSLDGPGSFEAEMGEADAADWLAGRRRIVVRSSSGFEEWAGWLTGLEESTRSYDDISRPRGTELKASGLGLASVLERRVVHGDFDRFMTVATTIAWNLLQHAQAQSDGDYGFILGTVTGTAPARTRHYCDGDVISDAINELAAKDPGGFDWEIDPTGALNMWVGGRGSATGLTLERSDAMSWDMLGDTSSLATYTTVIGDTDAECGAPLVTRSSGLGTTYGRLEAVIEMDSNDSGEMTEAADEEIRSREGSRLRLRASWPETDAPWAWRDVWLGDTLTVDLPAHFGGSQTMRTIEIGLSVEPPEFGYHSYEFEAVG